ncbi:DUF3923 family protein [Lysinibacillus sphaericus]|uniref:DUF3923 family protein n=1 Tax=Lysinibacillus sphaericus TaxID=1421 RepID=UPI00296FBA62
MKIWWHINSVWLFLFAVGAIFIGVRKFDGAGAVQTPEIRMVSFIILGIVFIIIVLIQLIFLYFVRKSTTQSFNKKTFSYSRAALCPRMLQSVHYQYIAPHLCVNFALSTISLNPFVVY